MPYLLLKFSNTPHVNHLERLRLECTKEWGMKYLSSGLLSSVNICMQVFGSVFTCVSSNTKFLFASLDIYADRCGRAGRCLVIPYSFGIRSWLRGVCLYQYYRGICLFAAQLGIVSELYLSFLFEAGIRKFNARRRSKCLIYANFVFHYIWQEIYLPFYLLTILVSSSCLVRILGFLFLQFWFTVLHFFLFIRIC